MVTQFIPPVTPEEMLKEEVPLLSRTIGHHEIQKFQINEIQAKDTNGTKTFSVIYCLPKHTIKEETYTKLFIPW